jgi:hypothetical protein
MTKIESSISKKNEKWKMKNEKIKIKGSFWKRTKQLGLLRIQAIHSNIILKSMPNKKKPNQISITI